MAMRRMKRSAKKTMRKSAKKSMRRMKRQKRVSKIARGKMQKSQVFKGRKARTSGGLNKSGLKKNKNGRVVSVKKSNMSKRRFQNSKLSKWAKACKKARSNLKIKGFCPVGGKTQQGKRLYAEVKRIL